MLFRLQLLAAMLSVASGYLGVYAQEAPEYQLKAAFLYNFAKFTEWPEKAFEDSSAPLVVGVLGDDPFGEAINIIRHKTVKNRKLEIRHFKKPEDIDVCHILFVSFSEKEKLKQISQTFRDSSILTVGDAESFIESGGVIQFVLRNEKLGFEVNAEAVRQAEFTISTQLLKFAKLVKTGASSRDD